MNALVAPVDHQLSTADGTALFVTDYMLPRAEAVGSIVLLHGLGEHSGRYRRLAQFFNACGLSVRCYDQRGHGRSGGARGDVTNGDPLLQDAQVVIDHFRAQQPRPPFLFGHSMGGLFAARYALSGRSVLRGLILCSPALAVPLSGAQALLLNALHAAAPWLGVPNGLKPQFLSHDPAVVAAYRADPLVHNKISARLLKSMLASIAFCDAHAATLAIPTLMLVAGDDRLVDAEGSKRFFAKAPPAMVQMALYPGWYHEVFNEPESARAFDLVRSWLAIQCGRA